MHLTLGERNFTITKATISGRTSNPHAWRPYEKPESALYWTLEINASSYFEHEGMRFSDVIRFDHESLRISERLHRWTDLVGQTIVWNSRHESTENNSLPMIYMGGAHSEVLHSTLCFVEHKGNHLRLQWSGMVETSAFTIDCWAVFEGIDVHCNQEDDATAIRSILAAHLDPDDFIQHPKQPAGGIAWFEPRI